MIETLQSLPLATLRDDTALDIRASADEREEIADRLGLNALTLFEIEGTLRRDADRVTVSGHVRAALAQPCVATSEPVHETVGEAFTLVFAPQPDHEEDAEIELGEDDLDTVFHDGRTIELGDALVDTLSLALDPFPRAADADARLRDAGVLSEEEAGKFGALAALKAKMEKGD